MNPSLLLLAPISIFAVLFFFGAVGCAAALNIDDVSFAPTYDATIKDPTKAAALKLQAYWRLIESGSEGAQAKDETGSHNGNYHVFPGAALNGDQPHHSPKTSGVISAGQPGLIASSPSITCNHFDGGYVQVGFKQELNVTPFSIECWVFPDDISGEPQGNYYCLFESSGPEGKTDLGPKSGFGLYVGPRDPKTTTGPFYWQVWLGDNKTKSFIQKAVVSDTANTVHFNALTYLLLTFDGTTIKLFLYYPHTNQNCDLKSITAIQTPVQNFQPNDNTAIGGGPFFIGSGSNLFPPKQAPPRLYPFKGKIQEVAFYNLDLSASDKLPGLLMSHIGCSGTM